MALPRGWEFILFTPAARQSQLRPDGHHLPEPVRGDQSIPLVLLAGRRFRYGVEIPVGAFVMRSGEVTNVQRKEGRSGAVTFVTRRYITTIIESGELAIEEEEDMVYRTSAATAVRANPRVEAFSLADRDFSPNETMLFRYSVLTNNAHRIHYDLPYAQQSEGFPGLVVNGGLTSLMMVELFRDFVREPIAIRTRMMRPLICGTKARVRIAAHCDDFRVWVENEQGEPVAEAFIR